MTRINYKFSGPRESNLTVAKIYCTVPPPLMIFQVGASDVRIGKQDIAQAALKCSSWSYAMSYSNAHRSKHSEKDDSDLLPTLT